ncbi:hypothetical protein BDV96DRAFT_269453 [Lophiotrema nucula]|uniref:Uncharacterized protein n=1 Tax=Lophiotrema nucula TaxID=690887 RepID=A0A6A5ZLP4_9PLEO|nr:hypothetical protein BDV96DRAFT_269453 [Lophiotrema nucula]
MAAAATALSARSGLPTSTVAGTPRSPTLSDAGMILPEADSLRSVSPAPFDRPPSPSSLLYAHSNKSEHTIRLAAPPLSRKNSPSIRSGSGVLSSKSSRSTIRTMGDSDGSSSSRSRNSRKSSPRNDHLLASSPTIQDALHSNPPDEYEYHPPRRGSNASSSVRSEDIEALKWPGFDGQHEFDDSGVVLEEEEEEEDDHFPVQANGDEEEEKDQWMDGHSDEGDDMYSSAALSRRAEIILANAKKRLNVMEGNLRGARQSLVVSPTFKPLPLELPHQLAITRDRDRRLYAGVGPIPPRSRMYQSSPLSSSPGHSRVLSETSVQSPYSPTNFSRSFPNKRASSAMGVASGPWSPEGYGQGRFPIRESRSFEVMRYHPDVLEERETSLRSHSRGSKSPPNTLETLPEDEDDHGHTLRRSSSTHTDLRSQMNDLKGRISSLKQRAKEDSMRRRSLQSLRTPSPFTSAEIWYGGVDSYKGATSPVAADAGVGTKVESPVRKAFYEDDDSDESTPRLAPVTAAPKEVDTHEEGMHFEENHDFESSKDYQTSHYDDAEEAQPEDNVEPSQDVPDTTNEHDFVSVEDEDIERTGSSVYEDAVYEMPVADRHEDRDDAFDYEHFFLHSAMGSYSSASRRSSSSTSSGSVDSVATTRPVTAIHERQKSRTSVETARRISMHQRNSSVDSVSTLASFATAAEEQSDDEEDESPLDQFAQQILPAHRHTIASHPITNGISPVSLRSDSAINMRPKSTTPPSQTPQISRASSSSPPADITSGLQTSKIISILTESSPKSGARLALNDEEKELIYGLASNFQQVCSSLQNTSGDQYERKEWRRRLDEARRILSGEELEGRPF